MSSGFRAEPTPFFRLSSELLSVVDADGRFLQVNEAWLTILGYHPAELLGRPFWDLIVEADREATRQSIAARTPDSVERCFINRYLDSQGQVHWLEWRSLDQEGYLYAAGQDITERITTQNQLHRTQQFLREDERSARLGHYIYQINSQTWEGSDSLYELMGLTAAGPHSTDEFYQRIHPEDRPTVHTRLQAAVVAGAPPIRQEFRVIPSDSETIVWVQALGTLRLDAGGRPLELFGTILDISDRKRAEAEAFRNQKLESLTLLASGLAHDINNYLSGIFGFIQLAELHVTNAERVSHYLTKARNSQHKAVNLTRQLMTFSREKPIILQPMSLTPLLHEVVEFSLSGSGVEVRWQEEPYLWQVEIDEGQIHQALTNILINARQAMGDQGPVTIRSQNQPAAATDGADLVAIHIENTGPPIPADILPKIFDPFFTTKTSGHGLGLAMVESIIRKHGGFARASNLPQTGACFSLYFPTFQGCIEDSTPDTPTNPLVTGKKLLVLDDDPFILEFLKDFFCDIGLKVCLVMTGEEAVHSWRSCCDDGHPFDLGLFDLTNKQGLGGLEAAQEIFSQEPQARIVVTSGYTENDALIHPEAYGLAGGLAKPFDRNLLLQVVHRLLSQDARG